MTASMFPTEVALENFICKKILDLVGTLHFRSEFFWCSAAGKPSDMQACCSLRTQNRANRRLTQSKKGITAATIMIRHQNSLTIYSIANALTRDIHPPECKPILIFSGVNASKRTG